MTKFSANISACWNSRFQHPGISARLCSSLTKSANFGRLFFFCHIGLNVLQENRPFDDKGLIQFKLSADQYLKVMKLIRLLKINQNNEKILPHKKTHYYNYCKDK